MITVVCERQLMLSLAKGMWEWSPVHHASRLLAGENSGLQHAIAKSLAYNIIGSQPKNINRGFLIVSPIASAAAAAATAAIVDTLQHVEGQNDET